MQELISITGLGSVSPLGKSIDTVWKSYCENSHAIIERNGTDFKALMAEIPAVVKEEIKGLRATDKRYKTLDNSVLFAIIASRMAVKNAGWASDAKFGINVGSSRGATSLFEKYHLEFIKNGQPNILSSPTTTLGNIASWIGHDLQNQGPVISHSITCSTALHALLNGVAWLRSGMTAKFLVGGSEAPLTGFTIAQMKALKVYAVKNETYPCRSLDFNKKQNSMVLGEGASVIALEKGIKQNAIAFIEGVGYATEILEHNISISTAANCFQKSMEMALASIDKNKIDAIVMHAPGTIKGDLSEYKAIEKIFQGQVPALTSNKWKIGHTLGASGMLSVELAILMLKYQQFIPVPFVAPYKEPKRLEKILVNAVGFGGNAVSVVISKA